MERFLILFIVMFFFAACGTKTVELGNPDFPDNNAAADDDTVVSDSDSDSQIDPDSDSNIPDSDSAIDPDDDTTMPDTDSVIDPDDDTVIDPDDDTVIIPDDDAVVTECTIGERKCDDTLDNVLECNVAHKWISVEDCSAPLKMCVEAEDAPYCKDLNCVPGTKTCISEDVYTCSEDGMTGVLSKNCTDTQYCDEKADPVDCKDMICVPNENFCETNILKECNAKGSSAATLKECGTGACDETLENCVYTSLIGAETSFSANNGRRGVFYNCAKNVTVIEFAQGFDLSSNTDLTWAIYEAEGNTTLYKKIYSKKDTVTSNGKGFYSTGAISVSLKSGKKYLFYTGWSGTRNFLYGGAGEHPVDMGFGSSFNGYNTAFSGTAEEEINNPAVFDRTYRQQIKFVE